MNWELYPDDILKPLTPYVYFNSAPNEILDAVSGELNKSLNSFQAANGQTNVTQAFQFLENVISSERAKESAFIEYLKNKTKSTFELKIPSLDESWTTFVRDIQQLLDFGNLGLQDLQNEYDRLVKNQGNYDKAAERGEKHVYYETDSLKEVQNYMKNLLQTLKEKSLNNQRIGGKIIKLIVENFGTDLFTINGNKLLFNRSELMALVLTLSQMISQNYQTKKLYNKSLANRGQEVNEANEDLNLANSIDEEMEASLQQTITSFKLFPHIRTQMVRNFGLSMNDRGKRAISSKGFTDKSGELITDTDALAEELFNILSDYEVPESTFKIVQKEPALAEINSIIKALSTGATSVLNTGSINAKPDNVIGYLTGDLSKLDPLESPRAKAIISRIERMNQLIEKNMLDKKNGGLSSANTAEYYAMRSEQWRKLERELNDMLKELRDSYDFLSNCFLIEDSTKNYLSLYTQEENGNPLTGPHGGSMGANMTDQLAKIEALADAGGITMIDKAWLIAAMINCGPNMIASGQKESLEDYLAMFAAILLFDSQINIAQDAMKMATEKGLGDTSVFQIHLFSVNGGYYPLSYVLKLTYDSLTKGLEQVRTDMMSQGVEVDIYGFVSEPKAYGKEVWGSTASLALSTTKFKMRFMVKLMNVIQNLLQLN